MEKTTYPIKKGFRNYYHDFDHDRFSEKVVLKRNSIPPETSVKIYTFQNEIIDQWNFQETWINGIVFGDYDRDGHDEAYFATHNQDSLFIYGLDIRDKNFFLFRHFILKAPDPNPNPKKEWDVYRFNGQIIDTDKDNWGELVFNLNTGYSLQPRAAFIFDIQQQKLKYRTPPIGSQFGRMIPYDFDSDGELEFLFSSYAPHNYHTPFPYSDDYTWIFLFDHHLKFAFPPIRFTPYYGGCDAFPIRFENENYILASSYHAGKLEIYPLLRLIRPDGTIAIEKKLSRKYSWRIFTYPPGEYSEAYIACSCGTIYRLNRNLDFIPVHKSSIPFQGINYTFDLDNDHQLEILISDQNNYIYIAEPGLQEITPLRTSSESNIIIPHLRYRGANSPELVLVYPYQEVHIVYRNNPLYLLNYALFSGVFILLLGFLEIGLFFLRQRKFEHGLTEYLLSRTPHGVLLLNHSGEMMQINPRLEKLLHLQSPPRVINHFREITPEQSEIGHFIRQSLEQRQPTLASFSPSNGDNQFRGTVRYLPLKFLRYFPVAHYFEFTESDQQNVPEHSRIWSKTVQKMVHDIKTPLSSVQVSLKTLWMKINDALPEAGKQLESDFNLLEKELHKVREMTRNFLKFTNLEKPHFQLCSLRELIHQVLQHFSAYLDGQIQVTLELDQETNQLYADPRQLEMVFQIVIENAIDAMQGTGHLLITSNLIQRLENGVESFVEIEFADTGAGIPESELDKVFEPYYTTKAEGTGMGLTIARKIIQEHGGEITIVSREEFSTVVRIILPLPNRGGEAIAENSGY